MGVTDHLQPGAVSNLVSSDELVFRATFLKGEVPPRQTLYWRGAVLDHSEGLEWSRSDLEGKRPPISPEELNEIEIYLEPGSERFLFALENTATLNFPSDLGGTRVTLKDGGIFELNQSLQVRERYFLQSGRVLSELSAEARKRYLQVPEEPSRELQVWLSKFANLSPSETVQKISDYFSVSGYTYTLSPPQVDKMEDFLFKTKTGFCEHYAATLASALRYLGIPARVVVGFQGESLSFLKNYITIQAHDTHA
jgi:transglutaminase-like putative cysteine protease